jgi:hypothetical protein
VLRLRGSLNIELQGIRAFATTQRLAENAVRLGAGCRGFLSHFGEVSDGFPEPRREPRILSRGSKMLSDKIKATNPEGLLGSGAAHFSNGSLARL